MARLSQLAGNLRIVFPPTVTIAVLFTLFQQSLSQFNFTTQFFRTGTISTSATVLMISRCPGDQTRNDCNQVSVRAASESLRVVFVLSVVISVCLPVSVSAQGFLFLQVTNHIPLHLLQTLLQQIFPGNLPDRFPFPL